MKYLRHIYMALLCILVVIGGCAQNPSNSSKALNMGEESTYGELPSEIGAAINPMDSQSLLEIDNSNLWELTDEYSRHSGEWFLGETGGKLGFSMTRGEMLPKSEVMISIQPHPENKVELNRQVRAQLTKRDQEMKRTALVAENITDIQDILKKETIFSTNLPDEVGAFYLLSVEVLDENLEVEDTLLTLINVPQHEMNLRIYTDEVEYDRGDTLSLFIQNYGPTTISFGTYYTIEKYINNQWQVAPLERNFNGIGLALKPGEETYSESISLAGLSAGQYRVIKTIQAEGTDLKENLAAQFYIVPN